MIHHDSALPQQLLHVPVGQALAQIQAHRYRDHLTWKRNPANAEEGMERAIRASLRVVAMGQRNTALGRTSARYAHIAIGVVPE